MRLNFKNHQQKKVLKNQSKFIDFKDFDFDLYTMQALSVGSRVSN